MATYKSEQQQLSSAQLCYFVQYFKLSWPIKDCKINPQLLNMEGSSHSAPSVNDENYNIFWKLSSGFLVLNRLAHKYWSDCVVCLMISRSKLQNKISSTCYHSLFYSVQHIALHHITFGGHFLSSLFCFSPFVCESPEAPLCFQDSFSAFSSHSGQPRRTFLPVKLCPPLWTDLCLFLMVLCK